MKSAMPTRKWWAAQVVALVGILVAWLGLGHWNKDETIALITWAGQAIATYLVPNLSTPGGVPVKQP